jgi:hypothetical protein
LALSTNSCERGGGREGREGGGGVGSEVHFDATGISVPYTHAHKPTRARTYIHTHTHLEEERSCDGPAALHANVFEIRDFALDVFDVLLRQRVVISRALFLFLLRNHFITEKI